MFFEIQTNKFNLWKSQVLFVGMITNSAIAAIVQERKEDEEHQLAGEFLGGDRVSKPVTIRVKYPQ